MDISGLPQFTINDRRQAEDGVVLTGRLSHLRGVRNSVGWLYRPDLPALVGSLSRVPAAAGEQVAFRSPEGELSPEWAPGTTCAWIDGYWQAYHIEMIVAGQWEPRRFVAEAAHYFRQHGTVGWQPIGGMLPEGAQDLGVRQGAWDHEHCELCREKIGGANPDGYVDPNGHWLCRACYERYAVPRDVSFAVEA